jgi:four helix bundle protein
MQTNLELRTLDFAKSIIHLCQKLPNNIVNHELVDQIIRSASSVGANYREANDSISKKDMLMRLRISRKEAKETSFWLELILEANPETKVLIEKLTDECQQLRNILSAIITKCS